jgi:hypothetical protein
VAVQPLFSPAERRVLESLLRHRVRFMIVGLSAAVLQGAHVVTQDIDLWFEELPDRNLIPALLAVGAGYVAPSNLNPPLLVGEGTELMDIVFRMQGLGSFAEEMKHTRKLRLGRYWVPVLSLERILASKEAANRPKDREAIPRLRSTLATLKKMASRKQSSQVSKKSAVVRGARASKPGRSGRSKQRK